DQGLTILTLPRDRLDQTFQTNTFGPLEVTQAFLSHLLKAGAARVVNVSSGYGQLVGLSPGVPSYCLSKLALNGLTIMLARALRGEGVAVNSVCPGWVRTDMGGPTANRSVEEGTDTMVWLGRVAGWNCPCRRTQPLAVSQDWRRGHNYVEEEIGILLAPPAVP